ncbi:molybdopterin-guanine dinucleotide biosynthesis protein B [Halovulum dunhuangense]|uniref:Molybdopterin-guanine dinucleotide biosynthesis protein B n=1 Tax=Halovulum dunhuangense TaxID=1505036 RepID=A0A849KZH6_9RHOB|nr:molybdopterin-guanine dinucleotide biosynthesis protein B [Halovulum dunhuangense]NNU79622.1 molybdopterin-guanine dinucleotide biosynthesis protein B [Halovulum dunhuangense]
MRIYGVTGWKNMGKTTLVERLVAHLTGDMGLRVSTVKHAHHMVDIDQPGRDSHRHREAGASEVVLSSARRIAFMHELRDAPEWPLQDILARMRPCDLVLVEGYKAEAHRKIEIFRPEAARSRTPLAASNPTIRAIAGDPGATGLPGFAPDAIAEIAAFILRDAEEPVR